MSVSESSSSASSDLSGDYYSQSLTQNKAPKEEKRDWIKIGAIVAAVVGALIVGLAVLCIMGIFPTNLLGGVLGKGITLIIGASILLPAAFVIYKRW